VPDPAANTLPAKKKAHKLGVRTEGVWVSCAGRALDIHHDLSEDGDVQEEDEMIWWAWDGKIAGFSEW
jgi:hypothetical protein